MNTILRKIVGVAALLATTAAAGAGMSMMRGGMMGSPSNSTGGDSDSNDNSQGHQVVTHYCAQCHALPSPSQHAADQWPAVVSRMEYYMRQQGRRVPTADETKAIEEYLGHDGH